MKDTEPYFIALARCYQVKAYDGKVLTRDDQEVYLCTSDGWPQCSRSRRGATRFKSPEEAMGTAHQWDGMPWYCRLKPGTLRIIRVDTQERLVPQRVAVETEVCHD